MLERRVHLLLDEQRYGRVAALAQQRGVSVAAVIRDAIDKGLPSSDDRRRRKAAAVLLAAETMPVPADPAELMAELDEMRGRRAG
ncbi:MAG: hypothetical protein ACR2FP_02835 [Nocardioidaceae bacterium]